MPTATTVPDSDQTDDDADEDEEEDEPSTPPSSPTHGAQFQTSALLHQVIQRLVKLSLRTFEALSASKTSTDEQQRLRTASTITPPSSPTFDGLAAPTPNTAMHAMKTSTFLRASSLNPFMKKSVRQIFHSMSPGEEPSLVDELIKGCLPRL